MIGLIGGTALLPGGRLRKKNVYLENGRIALVSDGREPGAEEIDCRGKYVFPGFIELHAHGGGGCDFADGSVSRADTAVKTHLRCGTTTIFPTLTSASVSSLGRGLEVIRDLMARRGDGVVAGAHVEGPYFNPAQCGAQNPAFLGPPRPEEYEGILERYAGTVRRWSYAPELDSDNAFAAALAARGVVASAGHTDARYEDVVRAERGGMRLITHLYSCTSGLTREKGYRRLGVIETALLQRELYAELIADGRHIPPELLRMVWRIKGAAHLCLVTDAMRAAGTDAVRSCVGAWDEGTPCIVEDGVAKLPDRSGFAGSVATQDVLLRTAVAAGIPLGDAARMLTSTPARVMNLADRGNLKIGNRADIAVLDAELRVTDVIYNGKIERRKP